MGLLAHQRDEYALWQIRLAGGRKRLPHVGPSGAGASLPPANWRLQRSVPFGLTPQRYRFCATWKWLNVPA